MNRTDDGTRASSSLKDFASFEACPFPFLFSVAMARHRCIELVAAVGGESEVKSIRSATQSVCV